MGEVDTAICIIIDLLLEYSYDVETCSQLCLKMLSRGTKEVAQSIVIELHACQPNVLTIVFSFHDLASQLASP